MNTIKKIGFMTSHIGIALMLLGYYFLDKNFVFFLLFYNYVLIPILDQLIGRDRGNVAKEEFENLTNDRFFDVAVFVHVYLQYALIGWTMYVLLFDSLSVFQMFGLIVSQGIYAGTIINVAHELGHRQSKIAQLHAKAALLSVCYMHFIIEHNRGHHVNVATPNDPASSFKNQTVFAFWWQSVTGSFSSAWHIEARMLQKKNQPVWTWQNEMIRFVVFEILFLIAFVVGFSFIAGGFKLIILVFIVSQSILAILLLETVNYIEHYGLSRKTIADNRFERVNPLHSWNASQIFSNLALFQLQRHSDHHAYASRPYQVLRHFDESPQLPFGYPVMVMMAVVPPLWFKIMNRELEKWEVNAVDSQHIAEVVKKFV